MRRRLFALLVLLWLGACTTQPTPEPTPTPLAEQGFHVIVEVQGSVRIQRLGWEDFYPAGPGTVVRFGDLLDIQGEIGVLCSDLSYHPLSGTSPSPCPEAPALLRYQGEPLIAPRAPVGAVPYILYPRRTKLAGQPSLLRWHDTGAATYRVTIQRADTGEVVWDTEVAGTTEVPYLADAPRLQPGIPYLLVVEDGRHSSQEDPAKGLGFTLLPPEQAEEVQRRVAYLEALPLSPQGRRLAKAVWYLQQGLPGEAVLLLESTAWQETPGVALLYGDGLRAMALRDEAEAVYQAALRRATQTSEVEACILALQRLHTLTGKAEYEEQAQRLCASFPKGYPCSPDDRP